MEAMEILAKAMGYTEWVDDENHRWPAGAGWGEHSIVTASLMIQDRIRELENRDSREVVPETV